ncbi:MAG: serine hydrolase, partial [Bradymonadaceae bacterium]
QVRRATAEQVVDRDWTLLLTPQRYSLGFMLGRKSTPFNVFGPDTEQTYGHLGFTRALGWANPKNQVAGAILTNGVPVRPTRELCIYRKLQNTIRRTFGSRGRS